ncbi:orotate phosphoribosyltransferase [Bacteroides hominis]|uniref:orotate phosphoribosyltransferase n=1 Tax=Bacteroides hominis TaxID=2763023 RepID=UPI00164ADA31|nr:orotate phosphoribosyltransferase [Bacteroides hominis (ex Liu et al. 2022)]MBC5614586.1 orotate phosphoribosyltransferase [Bacteroides hominis (ex Liu et al. 2022)]
MDARLWYLILFCLVGGLLYAVGFWRRKTADAAFAAARTADKDEERDRYCCLAVMAGHRDACRMFCFAHTDFFEDRQPLKPFKLRGIKMTFYGHYYPARYAALLDDGQRAFCRSIYKFKEGEIHGIEFFKACMAALQTDDKPYHIMFMPCSDEFKYARRFKRLDWYISKHRQELTSGLYDVDVFEPRESLHEAKGGDNRILERNYRITRNITGKEIIIIDDVLTTGQSVADYKEEIERCGGKVVAAIFYGKTITMPPLFLIKAHVWGSHIVNAIKVNRIKGAAES